MADDVYQKLATHLSNLGMGLPDREELLAILQSYLSPREAEVALLIPTKTIPLQVTGISEIVKETGYPAEELAVILEDLAERGVLFTGWTEGGEKGYALHQVGFGFPQSFFWKGEQTPQGRNLTNLLAKYFNRQVTREAFAGSATKPFRYVPVKKTLSLDIQAVYPYHMMEHVVNQAAVFAVAHCPCRVMYKMRGGKCDHPEEVCVKFDDMAQYLIDRGLGREISRDETLDIIKKSEEAGLVHFVDNAIGNVKHNCNCCGCACWSVGTLRRRKIPRDVLMATYFMRETDADACIGCGNCIDICPVDAVKMEDELPVVDNEWCIGCGVCARDCPTDAVKLVLRDDGRRAIPDNFRKLHETILAEKGLK